MNGSTPLTPRVDDQELYSALCGAASQDVLLMKPSEKALKTMIEDCFGTFDALQRVAAQKDVPLPVRQLALIQFKNHALSHWRSRKLMSDEMRQSIKQRTLSFLDEEDDTLAGHNAFVLARLARTETANNWHFHLATELMNMISAGLQAWVGQKSPDVKAPTPLHRALQYLHSVIKELVTVKMPSGIKATGQLVVLLYQQLFELYSILVQEIASLSLVALSIPRSADNIMLSHLVFKTLSRLSGWLFTQIGKKDKEFMIFEPTLRQFCQAAAAQFPALADMRIELALQFKQATPSQTTQRGLERLNNHVATYGKFFRRLQQQDKNRFTALPGFTEVVIFYWSKVVQSTQAPSDFVADSRLAVYPVRLLVQAMVLFQNSLSVWAPVNRKGEQNAVVMPEADVKEAVRILVQQFIPLKVDDLKEWENNPEQWINEEDAENDQWEYELRPCGERLLLTFTNQYPTVVIPLLKSSFSEIAQQQSPALEFILQKEALYCAVGRCAHRLKDEIPFNEWLASTLLAEARTTEPQYRIIKRRIAWVIGKWVSEQCASPQNPHVWEVLVHLLREEGVGTDTAVHVTAAVALCDCVDTIDFNIQVFLPFLRDAVSRLVHLASQVEDINTKRRIAKALNVVVERAGEHIVPIMGPIAGSIPGLWEEADDDWLFKASLVEITTKLVESTSEQSRMLHPIVVPLLAEGLLPNAMTHLDDDILTLWTSALRCSVPPLNSSPNIFDLLPQIIPLLDNNLDLLGKITSIVESYYLLDASVVLQRHAVDLFNAYKNSISNALSINVKYLLISLQILVQLAPSSLWGEAMYYSGLFPFLLKTLLDDEADSIVLSELVHLFARMTVTDSKGFCQLMTWAIAANPMKVGDPNSAAWEGLMDQWWNKFDSMSEPRHRKLTAMAMANLITSGHPVVLSRLPGDIFNLWLDVFGEVKEATTRSEERPDSPLTRYWEQDEAPEAIFGTTEGTPEYTRRKLMWDSDPVRTTQLTAFVGARLQETGASIPGGLGPVMAKADPTVLQQIRAELMSG